MIDLETVEECDECDGDNVYVHGRDEETGSWAWGWVSLESLYESGRVDLLEGLGLERRDEDEDGEEPRYRAPYRPASGVSAYAR